MDPFMAQALAEARAGLDEGGQPIGSVVVKDGVVLGRGRNTLYQNVDPTGHAEMEAYRDAARRIAATIPPERVDAALRGATVYTTAMPCAMCAGAIIHFAATCVVVAETTTYSDSGTRSLMERQGIVVEVLDDAEIIALVRHYLGRHPARRAEMTGEPTPPLKL